MEFEKYWEQVREEVNKKLSEVFTDDAELEVLCQYATRGGKRFRPTLVVLISDALNGDRDDAITSAAVIELIHTATLLHDDVIDEDDTRRGVDSFWRKFGIKQALFIGDGMIAKAYSLIKHDDAARIIGQGAWLLFKGFAKELLSIGSGITYLKYLDSVMLKTTALYATAAQLGVVSAKKTLTRQEYAKYLEIARNYGKYLGLVHQLADDLSDNDIPHGIPASRVKQDLSRFMKLAETMAEKFPESEYRNMLIQLPQYVKNRVLQEVEEAHQDG